MDVVQSAMLAERIWKFHVPHWKLTRQKTDAILSIVLEEKQKLDTRPSYNWNGQKLPWSPEKMLYTKGSGTAPAANFLRETESKLNLIFNQPLMKLEFTCVCPEVQKGPAKALLAFNMPDRDLTKKIIFAHAQKQDVNILRDDFEKSIRSYVIIPVEDAEHIVVENFNSPKTGSYRGFRSLWNMFRGNFIGISRKVAQATILQQEVKQMTEPHRIIRQPIVSVWPNELWEIDVFTLNDVRLGYDKDFSTGWRKDVLVVIDHFSKYAWTQIVNERAIDQDEFKKTGKSVVKETERHVQIKLFLYKLLGKKDPEINTLERPKHENFARALGHPKILQSDNEFAGKRNIEEWAITYGVIQKFSKSYSPNTQGLVERFNRTIKTAIKRWLFSTSRNLEKYKKRDDEFTERLQEFTDSYNASEHNVIKTSPHELYFGKKNEAYVRNTYDVVVASIGSEPAMSGGVKYMNCPISSSEEVREKNLNPILAKGVKWRFEGGVEQEINVLRAREGIKKQADVMIKQEEKRINAQAKHELQKGDVIRILRSQEEDQGLFYRKQMKGPIQPRRLIKDPSERSSKIKISWSRDLYKVVDVIARDAGPRLATRFRVAKINLNDCVRKVHGSTTEIVIPEGVRGSPLTWCYYRKDLLYIGAGEVKVFLGTNLRLKEARELVDNWLNFYATKTMTKKTIEGIQQSMQTFLDKAQLYYYEVPLDERTRNNSIQIDRIEVFVSTDTSFSYDAKRGFSAEVKFSYSGEDTSEQLSMQDFLMGVMDENFMQYMLKQSQL